MPVLNPSATDAVTLRIGTSQGSGGVDPDAVTLTRVSRPAARLIWLAELQDVLSLAPGTEVPLRSRGAAASGPPQ